MKKKIKKKENKNKTIVFGIIAFCVLLLFIVYGIVKYNDRKFSEYVKSVAQSDVTDGETLIVNDIMYASKKLEFKDVKLEVKNRKLYVNNKLKYIDDDGVVLVTGYYYQPGDTYNIYVLTGDEEIYSLTNVFKDEILEYDFEEIELDDVDKLILLDVTIENENVGMLPERNRVYAQVDEDLVLLR